MRAAVLVDEQRIEVQSRDRPEPGPGEVLVSIETVGVCGSDVHYFDKGRIGDFVVSYPLILGHEAAGTVAAVGEGVSESLQGEAVAVEPGVPCRECDQCKRGNYHLCPDMRFMATPPYDGALVEYITWPADFIYPLPKGVSTRAAALCEPLSCGLHATRTGGVETGDTVLVTGDGPIGLFTALAAERAGATTTILAGHHDEKLAVADAVGVDRTVNTHDRSLTEFVDVETDGLDVDVALDCSGAPSAIETAIDATRSGGVVVLYGLDAELTVPIDVVSHIVNEIDLRGAWRYSNTYPTAIDVIQDIDVDAIVDFHVPLAQTGRAFERVRDSPVVKGVIDVPG